jgi:hypothetical protein
MSAGNRVESFVGHSLQAIQRFFYRQGVHFAAVVVT